MRDAFDGIGGEVDLKPLLRLSSRTRVLFYVYAGVSAACMLGAVYQMVEYWVVWPSAEELGNTILTSDIVAASLSLLHIAVWIPFLVLLLMWIYRANKNLATLTGASIGFSPGWAVGCFFIPLANLVMPYQAVKQIWQVSRKGDSSGISLVRWWWALWVASQIIFVFAGGASTIPQGTGVRVAAVGVSVVAFGMQAAATLVGAAMIKGVGAAYEANYDEAATSSAPSGWYRDPTGRHEFRFWTGVAWHGAVADGAEVSDDPLVAPSTPSF